MGFSERLRNALTPEGGMTLEELNAIRAEGPDFAAEVGPARPGTSLEDMLALGGVADAAQAEFLRRQAGQ